MFTDNNLIVVSVDPIIFTIHENKLMVLLMMRNNVPFKDQLALPGGLMERTDNNLKEAVARVLANKTGITVNYMEQLSARSGHDPRGPTVSMAYVGLTDYKNVPENVQWVLYDNLETMDLAFDHKKVIKEGYERLITKVNYSTLPVFFLPEFFTLPELYNIYNLLLPDMKSNSRFRSKIDESNGVVKTDEIRHRGAARPAYLYKAVDNVPRYFNSNYIR